MTQIQWRTLTIAVWAAIALAGCATLPDAQDLRAEPFVYNTIPGAATVEDGRGAFRQVFCDELHADGLMAGADADCSDWLWLLPDEPVASAASVPLTLNPDALAVFLVTGAFAECAGDAALPYVAGAERLRSDGALVEHIVVSGRSGTASNARQIADVIERAQVPEQRQIIIVGFSKGSLDTLRFLTDFPAVAGTIDAVVSVAGPIYGTPLADRVRGPYAALLDKAPYDKCPPGDGGVLESLSPATATAWLASNPLPLHVRYYSITGFTTRKHVARLLVPAWKILNKTDVRNDGQVFAADAVIPGATLLGFANADHWGIAETIESVRTFLAERPDPRTFPLEQLFVAMMRFVSHDLRDQGAPGPGLAER
jgi:hypothetical protein